MILRVLPWRRHVKYRDFISSHNLKLKYTFRWLLLHLDEKNLRRPSLNHSNERRPADLFSQILTGIPLQDSQPRIAMWAAFLLDRCLSISGSVWDFLQGHCFDFHPNSNLQSRLISKLPFLKNTFQTFLFPSHSFFSFVVFSLIPYSLPDSHLDSIVGVIWSFCASILILYYLVLAI